jgi:hypothetical protein
LRRITAFIFFFTIASLLYANTALVLSQESSSFYAKFDDAKSELEGIYAELKNLRPLGGNGTSELRMNISAIKSELGIEDLGIEEVNAKIQADKNESARLNEIIPVIEYYSRDRILRYGVSAALGILIGIWISVLILSLVWRRRE